MKKYLLIIGAIVAGWFILKRFGGANGTATPLNNTASGLIPGLNSGWLNYPAQAQQTVNQTGAILNGTGSVLSSIKNLFSGWGTSTPSTAVTGDLLSPSTTTPFNDAYLAPGQFDDWNFEGGNVSPVDVPATNFDWGTFGGDD